MKHYLKKMTYFEKNYKVTKKEFIPEYLKIMVIKFNLKVSICKHIALSYLFLIHHSFNSSFSFFNDSFSFFI